MNTYPNNKEAEVDFQFKVQVVVKIITMILLFGTIVTVYIRDPTITEFIRQLDYWLLSGLALLALGFYLVGLWKREAKTMFMLARWGWPLVYIIASLLLTYKYF